MPGTMICQAGKKEREELILLWSECFPDSEDYIRLFWKENSHRMEVWVIRAEGVIAGSVYLLPAVMKDGEEEQPGYMIYAAGVRQRMRGHGLMKALLENLSEKAAEEGKVLFLKPGNEKLKNYYLSLGFREEARWSLLPVTPEKIEPEVSFAPLDAERYAFLREQAFRERAHIKWDVGHIGWAIEENLFCGGYAERVIFKGREYALLSIPQGKELTVLETTMPQEILDRLAGSIAARYRTEHITRISDYAGEKFPWITASMSVHNRIMNPYVNLMLI